MAAVIPGHRLGSLEEFLPGQGTYVRNGRICASLAGVPTVVRAGATSGEEPQLPTISVQPMAELPTTVPRVGSVVTSVNPQLARVAILCVGTTPLTTDFSGMIRVQDIRALEKDKVEVYKSFRPTDIVFAKVISLGDARSYYLSTAEDGLGVVAARSLAGAPLVPASWCTMKCSKTGQMEPRKVAHIGAAS